MSDYSSDIGYNLNQFFARIGLATVGPMKTLVALIQKWQDGEINDSDFAKQIQDLTFSI